MQYEVKMRNGSSYGVDAAYIEVISGQTESTYALLGSVPGYPVAILAAFPVDEVETIVPSGYEHRAADSDLTPRAIAQDDIDWPAEANGTSVESSTPPALRQLTEDIY